MKKHVLMTITMISTIALLVSCAPKAEVTAEESAVKTEVQEVEKTATELMEANKDTTPTELDIDTLITNALLKHYNTQFGNTDAQYKTTGYKMYVIEDVDPKTKKAYGIACYNEYNPVNGVPENTAGAGTTGIAISFSTDGTSSNVDYEVLYDDALKTEEFKKAFPEEVQKKLDPISQADRDEVDKKEQEMLKKLINK